MPPNFSVRDVTFTNTVDGVHIVVETDIPCRLSCRLTFEEPWIHSQPRLKRGLWLSDDVRFCFTVFEDNIQYEPGNTTTHTFWKTDWEVCTTKWCYFWATVDGVAAVSTSPIFEYHRTAVSPIPVPDILYTINSITPERIDGTGINTWVTHSLAGIVSPQATGICGIAVNSDAGQPRNFGIRIKDGSNFSTGSIKQKGMTGFISGLNDDLEFDLFVGFPGTVYIYVMGYFGRNVHFFNAVRDFHPPTSNVWTDIDTSPYAPGAQACLWSCGTGGSSAGGWKMRVKGSTDDRWNGGWHTYPCLGRDADGLNQVMVTPFGLTRSTTHLIGYIDSYFEKHVNSPNITPGPIGAWTQQSAESIVSDPPWVVIQEAGGSGATLYGLRKSRTWFDEKRQTGGGEWLLVHPDPDGYVDIWKGNPLVGFFLHGEFHPTPV